MTMPRDRPNLDDVMDTNERPTLHRREHAKASPHPDEEELEARTELERTEVEAESRGERE